MAFDHERHEIDVSTGFQVHKDDPSLRVGIDSVPHKPTALGTEWPKWVVPHSNHIERQGDHISTPAFVQFHINRADGSVTVLVEDEEAEALALADPKAEKAVPDDSHSDEQKPVDQSYG